MINNIFFRLDKKILFMKGHTETKNKLKRITFS